MLNYDLLENNIEDYAFQFANAKPQTYLVIDHFLEAEVAQTAFQFFPKMEDMDKLKDFRQLKAQDPAISKFHPLFQELIFEHLQSQRLLNIIAKISGIPNLIADEKLYASGLAQGENGSFLNVHIDNSSHPVQPWYRRLNLLVYLNPCWNEDKGGNLELWSDNMSESATILPTFNRMVLFATNQYSWHGYSRVNTPDGDSRKSINIYYFTEESPNGSDYYHVTSFRGRKKELINKALYPVDNGLRALARQLRPKKDDHAILFESDKDLKSNDP